MLIVSTVMLAVMFLLLLMARESTTEEKIGKWVGLVTSGVPLAYLISLMFAG